MPIEIIRTDSKNTSFMGLLCLLDEDLANRYGELQKQYDKHNNVADINDVILICKDKQPVGCGAFKEYNTSTVEIKRVFVKKEYRKQGLAKTILYNLEEMARSKGYNCAVLETGKKQNEAISFYKSIGYEVIQNYGPYIGNNNSICMKKVL